MRNLLLILAVLGFIATIGCNREQKLIDGTRTLQLGAEFLPVVQESFLDFQQSDSDPYWYYSSYACNIGLGGRRIFVRSIGLGGTKADDPKESQLDYIRVFTPNSSKDDAEQLYEDLTTYLRRTYTVKAKRTSPMHTSLSDRAGNTIAIELCMAGDDVWSVGVSITASEKTLKRKRAELAQKQESAEPVRQSSQEKEP